MTRGLFHKSLQICNCGQILMLNFNITLKFHKLQPNSHNYDGKVLLNGLKCSTMTHFSTKCTFSFAFKTEIISCILFGTIKSNEFFCLLYFKNPAKSRLALQRRSIEPGKFWITFNVVAAKSSNRLGSMDGDIVT